MDLSQFESRKRSHIRHALDPIHQATGLSGLERIHLFHSALPELDFADVSIASSWNHKPLRTPFYIAGMTAGHADAPVINRSLAIACSERGWAMGVGSQRRELETGGDFVDTWDKLRSEAPLLVLFANLGMSQVISTPLEKIQILLEVLRADALVIHANALQECLQPEGTPQFKGALEKLSLLTQQVKLPVVLKETGCGFSPATLKLLSPLGLAAIDVSGLGGTHWGRIEGARAAEVQSPILAQAAQTFSNWGEPTVECVLSAKQALVAHHFGGAAPTEIWASGGVRSGLDAAKLFALGAHRVGYAKPALEAALQGHAQLLLWMETQEYELKMALFCTGCRTTEILRQKEGVWRRNEI